MLKLLKVLSRSYGYFRGLEKTRNYSNYLLNLQLTKWASTASRSKKYVLVADNTLENVGNTGNTDNAARFEALWTRRPISATCRLLRTVSSHRNANVVSKLINFSRPRQIHPHRLPRPTRRYYISSESRRCPIYGHTCG